MNTPATTTPSPMHPTGSQEWLNKTTEVILEPDLPIIDPHHHLWGAPRPQYLLEEIYEDCNSGHNIIATIFADCTEGYRTSGPEEMKPVGETEFARAIAERGTTGRYGPTQLCAGIISYADLRAGARVREVLEAHIAAGNGLFKGVRQSTSWDADSSVRTTARIPPEKLLYDPILREGFAQLSPLGLTFDAWVYHPQLGDVASIADAFPEQTIILDHVGGPIGIGGYADKKAEVFSVWSKGIRDLAKRPNVYVKLGGLAMRLGGFGFHELPAPPTSTVLAEAWKHYIDFCIEAFGPERSMFESNFPVDKLSCSYAVLWNAFKRLAAGYTDSEKADLFSETAKRVYALKLASPNT